MPRRQRVAAGSVTAAKADAREGFPPGSPDQSVRVVGFHARGTLTRLTVKRWLDVVVAGAALIILSPS